MTFYEEMQELASGLLGEFNQGIISYIKSTPGSGPPDNPGQPAKTPFTLSGATASGVSKKYVDSGLAVATDLQVVANVDPRFIPDTSGSIEIDGVSLKILAIDKRPAAGTPVVYIYVVHRGPK